MSDRSVPVPADPRPGHDHGRGPGHEHGHGHEHDHAHGHGVALADRHEHEAEIYDAMAARILAESSDDDLRVDPAQIPFHNREHVDYLTAAVDAIRPLAGRRILEVGAGGGSLAVWLAQQGAEVVGIDVSRGILEVAARRAEVSGVADRTTFVHAPIEAFDGETGSFDAVIGNNVVHHFELDAALANLARLLAPGGTATFCEPVLFLPEGFRTVRNSGAVTRWFPLHTHTPDERSLSMADVAAMSDHFGSVRWQPFQLLCRLQNFVELSDRTWHRLEAVDRAVLAHVRPARRFCRMVVLTLTDPRPERTPR